MQELLFANAFLIADTSGSSVELLQRAKSISEPSIFSIIDCGYSSMDAERALHACGSDAEAALCMLYARLVGKQQASY